VTEECGTINSLVLKATALASDWQFFMYQMEWKERSSKEMKLN